MEKYKSSMNLFLVIVGTIILWPSCEIQENGDIFGSSVGDTGSLQLVLSSNLKTKLVAPNISMDVSSYTISGQGPHGSSFTVDNITGPSYTKTGLVVGTWTIVVEAKNSSGKIIGSTTESVPILKDQITEKTVTLTPLTGNGTLLITISWQEGTVTNPGITGTLTSLSSQQTYTLTFSLNSSSASVSMEIPADYYDLILELSDGSTKKWGKYEAVRILAGEISSGSYTVP